MNTFVVLKFLTQLATLLGLLASGLVAGVLLALLRLPRPGRLVAALGVALAVILSFNPVADALLPPLEDQARVAAAAAPPCCYDSIVVLGGGVSPAAPRLRPDSELTDSAARLWHAARLYRRGIAPRVVLSGGSYAARNGGPAQTEAEATRHNIREVRALVGAERVALVTSGYHMPRALRLARQAQLNAEAFPTDWQAVPAVRPVWETFLPSADALRNATVALNEHLALTFDRRGESLTP